MKNKPYLFFYIFGFICGTLSLCIGHEILEINVHDTYFIIAYDDLYIELSYIFLIKGFIYQALIKYNFKLSKILNTLNITGTIGGILLIHISFYTLMKIQFNYDFTFEYMRKIELLIKVLTILCSLFIVTGSLTFFINILRAVLLKIL